MIEVFTLKIATDNIGIIVNVLTEWCNVTDALLTIQVSLILS